MVLQAELPPGSAEGQGKDGLDTGFSRGIKAGTKVATTAKVPLLTPTFPL